ncbi:hypothetical protein PAHAL_4G329200 [Panicum hallii]|uniref:Uncharacterized protein n=1 Tax=Panicum hallii TaxID=206008 RepID=A0A2T8JEU5_9POAL|nr:hypothetical protein PAHAL_4G329200 [Panicum hallii]
MGCVEAVYGLESQTIERCPCRYAVATLVPGPLLPRRGRPAAAFPAKPGARARGSRRDARPPPLRPRARYKTTPRRHPDRQTAPALPFPHLVDARSPGRAQHPWEELARSSRDLSPAPAVTSRSSRRTSPPIPRGSPLAAEPRPVNNY